MGAALFGVEIATERYSMSYVSHRRFARVMCTMCRFGTPAMAQGTSLGSYPEFDGTSYVAGLCEAGAEAASPQLSGFRGHRPQLQEEIVSTIVP